MTNLILSVFINKDIEKADTLSNLVNKINSYDSLDIESGSDNICVKQFNGKPKLPNDKYVLLIDNNINNIKQFKSDTTVTMYITDRKKINIESIKYIDYIVDYKADDEIIELQLTKVIEDYKYKYQAWLYKYLLQTLIDSAPDMVWFKDNIGRHTILNKEFGRVVNKSVDFCLNKEHPDIWDIPWDEYKDSDFACRKSENEIINTGKTGQFEEQVLTNGVIKQFITYKTPLYDSFGNILGTCGIGHDCTNFSNIGLELDLLISNVALPIFICDKDFNIIRMNNTAEGLTNASDGELNYIEWKELNLTKTTEYGDQITYSLKNTSIIKLLEVLEQEIRDQFGNLNGYFCMFRDVTYQKMYEKVMHDVANTDELTKLYNRRYFYDTLKLFKNKEVTLLYLDLDNFKLMNDTYGHDRGDKILINTANIIKDRYKNDKVYRLGGDEFAVIIQGNYSNNNMMTDIEEMNTIIKDKFRKKDKAIAISAGRSYTKCLDNIDSFIKSADTKMYKMKAENKSGR